MLVIIACTMSIIVSYFVIKSLYDTQVADRDEKIARLQSQVTALHHERQRLLAPPICTREHVETVKYGEPRPTITEILHLEN